MTSQRPERPEPFDALETRLAARLTRHADRGVRPIDAAAIAHEAAAAREGQALARRAGTGATLLGRLGWLLAGAALAAGLIGGASWAGSLGLLGAAPTPSPTLLAVAPTNGPSLVPTTAPTEEPSPLVAWTSQPTSACRLSDLNGRVTAWDGAAGNRVATVVLTNLGSSPCTVPSLEQPRLIDGDGTVLIDGEAPTETTAITIPAGGSVSTEVDVANYCGPAPRAPVTIGFVFSGLDNSGTSGVLSAAPRSPTDVFGAPGCMGPGQPGVITMHPWAP